MATGNLPANIGPLNNPDFGKPADQSTWGGGSKPDDPTEPQNGGGTGKATNGKKSRFVSGNKNLRYPKDRIDDSDMDYLRIKIAEYRAPFGGSNLLDGIVGDITVDKKTKKVTSDYNIKTSGFKAISEATGSNANRKNLKDPKHMIVLPIPQQLSDISAIDWTDGKLNPIEAYGLAATSTIIQAGGRGIGDAGKAAKDIVTQLGASIGSAANDPNIQNALMLQYLVKQLVLLVETSVEVQLLREQQVRSSTQTWNFSSTVSTSEYSHLPLNSFQGIEMRVKR